MIIYDINSKKMETFNIFKHGRFSEDVLKSFKKYKKDKEQFISSLRSSLMYYYWCKAEWEILIEPWVGGKNVEPVKIDVYWQVMNNWERFSEYVWNSLTK